MGRDSQHERSDSRSRKRRKSSDLSSDENTNRDRITRLEALVQQLSKSPRSSSHTQRLLMPYRSCAGDELLIPTFDLLKEIITVEQWVNRVDQLARQYDWDDRYIFRLIVSRMEGHAKDWFQYEQHNAVTWSEIKVAMVQHFKKSIHFAKLLKEAVNYETTPGQSLGDYCLKKLNKIRKCNLGVSDECIIDLVIDGVKNHRIAGDIRAADKNTINALYNHMLSLGEVPGQLKQQRLSREKGNSGRMRGAAGVSKTSDTLAESENKITIRCYNCGSYGHVWRRCPKPHKETNVVSREKRGSYANNYFCEEIGRRPRIASEGRARNFEQLHSDVIEM